MSTHDHDAPASSCCHAAKATTQASAQVKDPVCGMQVDPASSTLSAEHGGQTYHFCSAGCRTKFVADPLLYLDADKKPKPEKMDKDAIYTCPMHP